MILRDRVGGGGSANWSFCDWIVDDLLRDLTVSLAWSGNGFFGDVCKVESVGERLEEEEG